MSRHGRPTPTSRERSRRALVVALLAFVAVVSGPEIAPSASVVSVAAPTLRANHKGDDHDSSPARNPPPPAPTASEPTMSSPSAPAPAPAASTPATNPGEPPAGSTAPAPVASGGEAVAVEPADPERPPLPAAVSDRLIEVSGSSMASVMVACSGQVACRGTLVIDVPALGAPARAAGARVSAARKGRRLRIGKTTFSVAPGSTSSVRVRMSRRGRKLLGRSKRIRARATIASAGTSVSFPITLRAGRGGHGR